MTASTVARAALTPRPRAVMSADLLDEHEDEEEGHGQSSGEDSHAPVDLAHAEGIAIGEGGEHVGGVTGPASRHELHIGEVAHGEDHGEERADQVDAAEHGKRDEPERLQRPRAVDGGGLVELAWNAPASGEEDHRPEGQIFPDVEE